MTDRAKGVVLTPSSNEKLAGELVVQLEDGREVFAPVWRRRRGYAIGDWEVVDKSALIQPWTPPPGFLDDPVLKEGIPREFKKIVVK